MTTFTISLPDHVAEKIDATVRLGFATRSEFFRDVLRKYFSRELTFEPFTKKPLEEIEKDLTKTGKYNKAFIKSVIKGLEKSSIYAS